jgi:RimJ/RimL family protein N-acetyltransferase
MPTVQEGHERAGGDQLGCRRPTAAYINPPCECVLTLGHRRPTSYNSHQMETLFTERLVLRPLRQDDLGSLAVLQAEPSFWHYPLRRGQTRAETEEFLRRALGTYTGAGFGWAAVVERESDALAGWAGLSVPNFLPEVLPAVEVGWRLGAAFRGRGYATEAGSAWAKWGFETLGLEQIVSIFEPENEASGRVMTKLGFELDRVTMDPGRRTALHVTVLTRLRWLELCAAGEWPRSRG